MSSQDTAEKHLSEPSPALLRDGLGLGFSVNNIREAIEFAHGSEGRIDIKITNQLSEDIEVHFQGGRNCERRELLQSGMTRVFSKKPKDGPLLKTTNYECEFWAGNKHAKMFVYGVRAPRKGNNFEVREEGVFLIEKKNAYNLQKWDLDEIDFCTK